MAYYHFCHENRVTSHPIPTLCRDVTRLYVQSNGVVAAAAAVAVVGPCPSMVRPLNLMKVFVCSTIV